MSRIVLCGLAFAGLLLTGCDEEGKEESASDTDAGDLVQDDGSTDLTPDESASDAEPDEGDASEDATTQDVEQDVEQDVFHMMCDQPLPTCESADSGCGFWGPCGSSECVCRTGTRPSLGGVCAPLLRDSCNPLDDLQASTLYGTSSISGRSVVKLLPHHGVQNPGTPEEVVHYGIVVSLEYQRGEKMADYRNLRFEHMTSSGHSMESIWERVQWPLAKRDLQADMQRAQRTGSAGSLLLVDVASHGDGGFTWFVVDNGPPGSNPQLNFGVAEPGVQSSGSSVASVHSALGFGFQDDLRVLSIAASTPDELFMAVTSEQSPTEVGIYKMELSENQVTDSVEVTTLTEDPDDFLNMEVDTEGRRLVANVDGAPVVIDGIDSGSASARKLLPVEAGGVQQSLTVLHDACGRDLLLSRVGAGDELAATLLGSDASTDQPGGILDISGGERLYSGMSNGTISVYWSKDIDGGGTIVYRGEVNPWTLGIIGVQSLGVLFDPFGGGGSRAMQVAFNEDGVVLILFEDAHSTSSLTRLNGVQVMIDYELECEDVFAP